LFIFYLSIFLEEADISTIPQFLPEIGNKSCTKDMHLLMCIVM